MLIVPIDNYVNHAKPLEKLAKLVVINHKILVVLSVMMVNILINLIQENGSAELIRVIALVAR